MPKAKPIDITEQSDRLPFYLRLSRQWRSSAAKRVIRNAGWWVEAHSLALGLAVFAEELDPNASRTARGMQARGLATLRRCEERMRFCASYSAGEDVDEPDVRAALRRFAGLIEALGSLIDGRDAALLRGALGQPAPERGPGPVVDLAAYRAVRRPALAECVA